MTGKYKTTSQRLGLGSYRGRYLWVTASLSFLLVGLAIIAQQVVRDIARDTSQQASKRTIAISALTSADHQLHKLQEKLANFVLDPTDTDRDDVSRQVQLAASSIEHLAHNNDYQDPGHELNLSTLNAHAAELQKLVDTLIAIRLDTHSWLPASRVMDEQMTPQVQKINTALSVIESMLREEDGTLALRHKTALLNIEWQHIISEARLIIANRFGVFSTDPINAMQGRASNLESYLESFEAGLFELIQQAMAVDNDFVLDEFLGIQSAMNTWHNAYQLLSVLMNEEGWRQDLTLLHSRIDPLIDDMSRRLNAARLQMQSDTQSQLLRLVRQGDRLVRGIGWLTAILIGLFGLGYLGYKRWMLDPIEHISEQLQREGRGEGGNATMLAPVSETIQLVQSFSEMREQVRARERRLDYMAYHDPLTGLPNRVLFHERLNDALQNDLPRKRNVAVLFMDMDRFKNINDTHGHLVGDKFLVEVAHRLRGIFRAEDLVARLSGDEFAVLLQSYGAGQEPGMLAQKVIDTLSMPFKIDGATFHSSASIGMSVAPHDGDSADRLIQHADTAMYHAKATGRAKYAHFTPDMLERSASQLALENELHTALQERQFRVFAQPIVDSNTGELHSHECLIRWQHPEKGLLPPGAFLDTLEDMGLIRDVTDWILDQLEQTRVTQDQAYSINLSALQLADPGFLSHLQRRIRTGDIQADRLIIEITEDTLSDDLDRITLQLADLQAIGVRIALDDFGTGQSSLSHLRAFPFDTVKIDRSFIHDITDDHQDATLIRAIIGLAHTLGMNVVAEGVETPEQLAFLRAEDCDLIQGYLFGRPAPLLESRENVLAFTAKPA